MVKKKYIPKRGDVVWTNLDPAAGHEQTGKRPALVLSPTSFNRKIMLAMVAPITSRVRGHGFEVPPNGKKVEGVALCQQVKMIDFTERGVQFAEKAPEVVTSDALAKVRAIVTE
ncbi:MAG: mRNA-degrading endonuclease [Desulfobulbaceae bacterium]|nr:mRNA-degrading endonuclease [Desulfobulbaceae bacterium]